MKPNSDTLNTGWLGAGQWNTWAYNPRVGAEAQLVPDPAHVVQMQIQMHAVGVPIGFLGVWTPMHGVTLFQVPYCSTFMAFASKVMQLVADAYLLPQSRMRSLPSGNIMSENSETQQAWSSMMQSLGCVCQRVERLAANGTGR
jgi:hypothetical protein